MNSKIITNGILKAFAIIMGIIVVGYFLLTIQSVLVYIIIAAIIALIAKPIILFLRLKLKFPNILAVISTMLLFMTITLGVTGMFIPLVIEQGESLSLLKTTALEENIGNLITQANDYFESENINILNELQNADIFTSLKTIPNLLNSIVGALGSLSIGLFSVLFISFFFMKDNRLFKNALLTLIPKGSENKFSHSLEKINDLLSRYFIGLVIQISILFFIYTLIFLIVGVSNAVVIAFLCALLNIIPYVGPLISAFLMIVLTMTSGLGQSLDFQTEILPKTVYVMIGFIIAQIGDNFISQPIIFSKTTKSHPLEIFLIIIIGGLLAGPLGMIIAVPSYTALKVILKEFMSHNKIVSSLTKEI